MATYNGTLKKWNQVGADWDILYPKTTAENIISGTLDPARIPSLNASKIGAGTLDAARIPSLDASKIGAGTIDAARLPAIAITNSVTYTTMTAFEAAYTANNNLVQLGDIVILTTDKKTYIHNGGTTWSSADLTLLQTPTDLVSSVNGKVGVVTLGKGDVGLGNVDNTADTNKEVLSATKLKTARLIGGVSFDGGSNISLRGVDITGDQDTTGNAATATKLATAKLIGGVSFDGSANINLPGVNTAGTQNTSGNAATATKLATARTIAGVSFDGSANIAIPYANLTGLPELYAVDGAIGRDVGNHLDFGGQSIDVMVDQLTVMIISENGSYHNMKNHKLTNVVNPTNAQDAATKNYVDTHQLMLADALPTTGLVDGQMGFEY